LVSARAAERLGVDVEDELHRCRQEGGERALRYGRRLGLDGRGGLDLGQRRSAATRGERDDESGGERGEPSFHVCHATIAWAVGVQEQACPRHLGMMTWT